MNICFATSECVPFAKTGGLADVAGSLPVALDALGHKVKVFMPLYQSINTIDHGLVHASDLGSIPVQIAGRTAHFYTWYGRLPGSDVDVYFIDCPLFYHRPGLYTNDWDEHSRFILLQHAAFKIMQRYSWSPDIIHCNDWHTALMPAMLISAYRWDALFQKPGTVLTIHNIGYQGQFHASAAEAAGLPGPTVGDSFSFMRSGLFYSDAITTVSETYAREIQTPKFGAGLDPILSARSEDVFGIVNGIDTDAWNPKTDPFIERQYTSRSLGRKLENKKALCEEMGLPFKPEVPLVGIVSRFTSQKGLELLKPVLWDLAGMPVQFVVLGSGDSELEAFFGHASVWLKESLAAYIGFSNELAHKITAGADMFLMPSAYEPCGMNQMFSMRYGTIPVVHKTGGLADTVRDFHEYPDEGTGFSFTDFAPGALVHAFQRAVGAFQQKENEWKPMQLRGMKQDFSWDVSARKYVEVYERVLSR
jgi:starch synthase